MLSTHSGECRHWKGLNELNHQNSVTGWCPVVHLLSLSRWASSMLCDSLTFCLNSKRRQKWRSSLKPRGYLMSELRIGILKRLGLSKGCISAPFHLQGKSQEEPVLPPWPQKHPLWENMAWEHWFLTPRVLESLGPSQMSLVNICLLRKSHVNFYEALFL
jgi:hypothetical protein